MVQRADLFERVREWIVSDIVKERCGPDDRLLVLANRRGVFGFAKERQSATGEMVRPERVLEPGVGGAGIDQVGPPQLGTYLSR